MMKSVTKEQFGPRLLLINFFLAALSIQPSLCLGSGIDTSSTCCFILSHLLFWGDIEKRNGCLLQRNTGIISSEGKPPEGPIEDLDACSSACKSQPDCDVFYFQSVDEESEGALEEGNTTSEVGARACLLFTTGALVNLTKTSGTGTVGYCPPGDF